MSAVTFQVEVAVSNDGKHTKDITQKNGITMNTLVNTLSISDTILVRNTGKTDEKGFVSPKRIHIHTYIHTRTNAYTLAHTHTHRTNYILIYSTHRD